jgi:hypothetical protein
LGFPQAGCPAWIRTIILDGFVIDHGCLSLRYVDPAYTRFSPYFQALFRVFEQA